MSQLLRILQTFASFVVVLAPLVFIHEFGHFIVAKAFKIGVPVFSLGFGPRIWGFRRRETEYRLSAIPLGGYVRLAGDEADEARTGGPEEFLARPPWQRFLVFAAGATFNIVFAIVTMTAIYSIWGKDEPVRSSSYPVVAGVIVDSPAASAGVRDGDKVLAIGGRDARERQVQFEEITISPDQVKAIEIERGGVKSTVRMGTGQDPIHHLGAPGWRLVQEGGGPPRVDMVIGGSAADRAGLKRGDLIVNLDGTPADGELEVRAVLERSAGRAVQFLVERDGRRFDVAVTPTSDDGKGKIGVMFADGSEVRRQLGVGAAFTASLEWAGDTTRNVFRILGKLVRFEISLRAMSGPLEIASVSRDAVRSLEFFFTWLSFISLQLGIFNLLPIPVLDGGHIFILGFEAAIRRDLSDRVKERVMTVGLVFLLAFFGAVLVFDVLKMRT